jgi:hypothetical protein
MEAHTGTIVSSTQVNFTSSSSSSSVTSASNSSHQLAMNLIKAHGTKYFVLAD